MHFDSELALATDLARHAGDAILAVRSEAISTSSLKSDESPVTKADLAADAVIRKGLLATGDVVVTEETWANGLIGHHARSWFIDPIDGTEDFIAGRADYVVQIGFCVDGKPTLGVLFQPETGLCWRGVVGQGCERLDLGKRDVATRELVGKPRIAVSVSHPSNVVEYIVNELGGVAVRKGSVGLKAGLIVDDEADAYVTASKRIKVWDTCAPAAVLLAAGGVVEDLDGKPLVYDGPAPHANGVVMWTPAARRVMKARVDDAIARFRASQSSRPG